MQDPDATARAHSKICGSTVIVDLNMVDNVVNDYAQDVKTCALGKAAASVMGRNIIGCGSDELLELRDSMYAMLKGNGDHPAGIWSDLECLLPVREIKSRHASVLLVFDAVADAIGQILEKEQ